MRRGALSAKSVGSRYDMEPAAHHGSSPDSPLEGRVTSEPVSEVGFSGPRNYGPIPRRLWMMPEA